MWVVMDRLTKSAHFLVAQMFFTLEDFDRLYIREIVRLHGVPVSIVLDRDPRFIAYLWNYMGGHVDLRFVGLRWGKDPLQVRIWLETPLRRWS